MHLGAKPMPRAMHEKVAIARIGNHAARGVIDHMGLHARSRRLHRGARCRVHDAVDFVKTFGCFAHDRHARDVRRIAPHRAADIHHHRVPRLQNGLARLVMGKRAVAARADDIEHRLRALIGETRAYDLGHLPFGHPDLHRAPGFLHGAVRAQRVLLQNRVFLGILAHPQRTDGAFGKLALGVQQPVLHQAGVVGPHAFIQRIGPCRRDPEVRQHALERGRRPLGIGPLIERQIRVLARAFRLKRGHQEPGILARDAEQQRTFIGMRGQTRQPFQMRARRQRHQVDAFFGHFLAQVLKSCHVALSSWLSVSRSHTHIRTHPRGPSLPAVKPRAALTPPGTANCTDAIPTRYRRDTDVGIWPHRPCLPRLTRS